MTDRLGGTEPSGGREPTEAQLVVPRSSNRGLLLGATVIAVVLVLAVLKPWGAPGGPGEAAVPGLPSAGPAAADSSPGPTATPSATSPGLDEPGGQCFPGTDWRLFAIEVNEGRPRRHWLSIEPGLATGPRDPAVPFVSVVTDRLLALGFCVGSGPDGPPPLTRVQAWAPAPASAGQDVPVALAPLVAYMPHDPDLGAIYQPPPESTGAVRTVWTPGCYVFAVQQGPPVGDEWWFGVEVVAAPSASTAPGPSEVPAASPVPGASAAPGASPQRSPAP